MKKRAGRALAKAHRRGLPGNPCNAFAAHSLLAQSVEQVNIAADGGQPVKVKGKKRKQEANNG
jgi:hypothetical protein